LKIIILVLISPLPPIWLSNEYIFLSKENNLTRASQRWLILNIILLVLGRQV